MDCSNLPECLEIEMVHPWTTYQLRQPQPEIQATPSEACVAFPASGDARQCDQRNHFERMRDQAIDRVMIGRRTAARLEA
jgi:hypothetical protein